MQISSHLITVYPSRPLKEQLNNLIFLIGIRMYFSFG